MAFLETICLVEFALVSKVAGDSGQAQYPHILILQLQQLRVD